MYINICSTIQKFRERGDSRKRKKVPKVKPPEMYSPNSPLLVHVVLVHVMSPKALAAVISRK